jgi:hypothetical protein
MISNKCVTIMALNPNQLTTSHILYPKVNAIIEQVHKVINSENDTRRIFFVFTHLFTENNA